MGVVNYITLLLKTICLEIQTAPPRDIHKNVNEKTQRIGNISGYAVSFSKNRKKLVNREIETVVLMYINPINSRKSVTSFSCIFHSLVHRFFKKNL